METSSIAARECGLLVIQVLGPTRLWRDGTEIGLGPAGRRAVLGLLVLAGAVRCWVRASSTCYGALRHPQRHQRDPDPCEASTPALRTRPASSHAQHGSALAGGGYALRLPAGAVDLDRFHDLLTAAAEADRHDDPRRVAALLADALDLWQGAPFADVPALAGHPMVRSLLDERRTAVARYTDVMLALGSGDRALPLLREEAAAHPLDEVVQTRLVQAHHAVGRRAEALAAYDVARRHLAEELGVGPGPDLVAAYLRVLNDEAPVPPVDPLVGTAPTTPQVNQLPAEAAGFTGREAELSALDELVRNHGTAVRIGVICGTAGVGKTTLAVQWAHRRRDRFPAGQLHLDLRGYDPRRPVSARAALGHLLESLGVPAAAIPTDLDRRAARYRAETAGRSLLILLDNAASVDQVRP